MGGDAVRVLSALAIRMRVLSGQNGQRQHRQQPGRGTVGDRGLGGGSTATGGTTGNRIRGLDRVEEEVVVVVAFDSASRSELCGKDRGGVGSGRVRERERDRGERWQCGNGIRICATRGDEGHAFSWVRQTNAPSY